MCAFTALAGCAEDEPAAVVRDEFRANTDGQGDRLSPAFAEGSLFTLRYEPRRAGDLVGWTVRSNDPSVLEVSSVALEGQLLVVTVTARGVGKTALVLLDDAGAEQRSDPLEVVAATLRLRIARDWGPEAIIASELRMVEHGLEEVAVEYVDARGFTVAGARIDDVSWAAGKTGWSTVGAFSLYIQADHPRERVTIRMRGGQELVLDVIAVPAIEVATARLELPDEAEAADGAELTSTLIARDAEGRRLWAPFAAWTVEPGHAGDRLRYQHSRATPLPFQVTLGNLTLDGVIRGTCVHVVGSPRFDILVSTC